MAVFIDRNQEWRRYEKRRFRCSITDGAGNPIDLTGVQLEFQLRRSHRDTTVAFKRLPAEFLPPEIPAGGTVPSLAVWEISDTESGALQGGWYFGQLWDRSNDDCLASGGVILLPGLPVPTP
jgi:hypothetical protein